MSSVFRLFGANATKTFLHFFPYRKSRKSIGRDFRQLYEISAKTAATIYKFNRVVAFAEFDDRLKYRIGAEIPKSYRQSFIVRFALHNTNADCRTSTRAVFYLSAKKRFLRSARFSRSRKNSRRIVCAYRSTEPKTCFRRHFRICTTWKRFFGRFFRR